MCFLCGKDITLGAYKVLANQLEHASLKTRELEQELQELKIKHDEISDKYYKLQLDNIENTQDDDVNKDEVKPFQGDLFNYFKDILFSITSPIYHKDDAFNEIESVVNDYIENNSRVSDINFSINEVKGDYSPRKGKRESSKYIVSVELKMKNLTSSELKVFTMIPSRHYSDDVDICEMDSGNATLIFNSGVTITFMLSCGLMGTNLSQLSILLCFSAEETKDKKLFMPKEVKGFLTKASYNAFFDNWYNIANKELLFDN